MSPRYSVTSRISFAAPVKTSSIGKGSSFSASFRIEVATSMFAESPHLGQMTMVSSPIGVNNMNSCEILPPIMPESDLTAIKFFMPMRLKILS